MRLLSFHKELPNMVLAREHPWLGVKEAGKNL